MAGILKLILACAEPREAATLAWSGIGRQSIIVCRARVTTQEPRVYTKNKVDRIVTLNNVL